MNGRKAMTDTIKHNTLTASIHERKSGFRQLVEGFACEWKEMTADMKRILYIALLTVFAVSACDFLEPLPDGSYNEENYTDYPTIIRGYIDKAYNLRPSSYHNTEYMGTDAASDDMIPTIHFNKYSFISHEVKKGKKYMLFQIRYKS